MGKKQKPAYDRKTLQAINQREALNKTTSVDGAPQLLIDVVDGTAKSLCPKYFNSSSTPSSILKLNLRVKRMKAKQRFVLLGVLMVVLFTTRDKWIPHLRQSGLLQKIVDPMADPDSHTAKHHVLKSAIRHHAGHFRGDRIQIGRGDEPADTTEGFVEGTGPEGEPGHQREHIDRWENHLEDLSRSAREQAKKKEVQEVRAKKKAALEEAIAKKRAERIAREKAEKEKELHGIDDAVEEAGEHHIEPVQEGDAEEEREVAEIEARQRPGKPRAFVKPDEGL